MDRKSVFGWLTRSPKLSNPSPNDPPTERRLILAIIREDPFRHMLQSVSEQAGWPLEVRSCVEPVEPSAVPSIVIYDRGIPPGDWREVIRSFARLSPRPYVILLSSSIDDSLWEEVQRAGGSDILRSPATPDRLIAALCAGWQLWSAERRWRDTLRDDTFSHGVKD